MEIDLGGIRVVLTSSRDYWAPAKALAPGIQKNLARGKPLPPGIAKKLDGRLLGRLPHYDGYDWVQAGADLVLLTVATGIIHEVLLQPLGAAASQDVVRWEMASEIWSSHEHRFESFAVLGPQHQASNDGAVVCLSKPSNTLMPKLLALCVVA